MHTYLAIAVALVAASLSVEAKFNHPTRIVARAPNTLDAAQSSAASVALSIYNSVGTTAFAAATAGVCRTGYQPYTATSGTIRCCMGSIINDICFVDDEDIFYDADPYAVLDGTEDAPADAAVGTAATTTVGGTTVASATSTRSSSTINYLTATTFRPTATGATTTRGAASNSSTSYSQLSLTLEPTGDSVPAATSGATSGATRLTASFTSAGMTAFLGSLAAAAVGGFVAML